MRILILLAVVVGSVAGLSGQSKWGAQPGPIVLSWTALNDGPLFVADAQPKSKGGLVYDRGDFSLHLANALSYDRESDRFSFWLGRDSGEQLVLLSRSAGAYRGMLPGQGDVGLNDLGKLKMLWTSSGERFLFTEVSGSWRCVMIEDPAGRKLYIDYDRYGAIVLVRDDGARTVEPVYKNGRMESVYQIWPSKTGGRELAKTEVLQ